MRFRTPLAYLTIGAMALAGVSTALAQDSEKGPKIGDYAPDFEAREWILLQTEDEVPSLSQLRGLAVVLMFWVSWHDGAEAVLPHVNAFANGQGFSNGVVIVGLTDADRRSTEPVVRGAKAMFPVGCGSKAAAEYGFENGWGVVVIDPEGKVRYKGQPQDLNGMSQQLQDMFNNTPPTRCHPAEAKIINRRMDEARGHLGQGNFREANKALEDALSRAVVGDKLSSEVQAMYDLVELVAYERLSLVDRLIDGGKFKDVAEILRTVSRRFKGFESAKDARERIEKLSKDNDKFKSAMAEYGGEDAGHKLLVEARGLLKGRKIGEGWAKLDEIVTKYPSSESAEVARGMIARMQKIDGVWGYVVDYRAKDDCEHWITDARNAVTSRKYADARSLLERIMKEHPDSMYAEQAKEMLIKLP